MIFLCTVVGRPPTTFGGRGLPTLAPQSQEGDLSRQVELVSLRSALADIDGKLRTLEESERTPGETLVLREYFQHERQKLLLEITLFQQQSRIEELERAYKFSQTPGAQANYRRRVSLLNSGRLLGRSRETHLPSPPEVESRLALQKATAERSTTQRELQELCSRDAEWNQALSKTIKPEAQSDSPPIAPVRTKKPKQLSPFDELAGRLMMEARPRRSEKRRLPDCEWDKVLVQVDNAGFKPLKHLGRQWRERISDWNQKNSKKLGAIQTFQAAAHNRHFRRGVLKRLYQAEQNYLKTHFPLSTT